MSADLPVPPLRFLPLLRVRFPQSLLSALAPGVRAACTKENCRRLSSCRVPAVPRTTMLT
jgi:hypothetical protein